MSKLKLEIIQATSPENNTYLIHRFDDGNTKKCYEIYKLVRSIDVAREFGIEDGIEGRPSNLNTREMCDKMVEKIKNKASR
jgi:hypothetical protein